MQALRNSIGMAPTLEQSRSPHIAEVQKGHGARVTKTELDTPVIAEGMAVSCFAVWSFVRACPISSEIRAFAQGTC